VRVRRTCNFLFRFRWLAGAALVLVLTGCTTAEPDNLSARPWNSPTGWENSLPSAMTEGR